VEILDGQRDVLTIRRGPLTVVLNCGAAPVSLPDGELLIASGELGDGKLPADTAVWIRESA
jgi:alpha-glucosidase